MALSRKMKFSFTLDESDTAYFRNIYRAAKQHADPDDWDKISRGVRRLVNQVRSAKRVPHFVLEAVQALEDLMQLVEDEHYKAPKAVASRATAALAYFANPHDVIPDDVPLVGFLDDAIMIKFVEEDLKNELWGYRKFKTFREGAEQRDWTPVAKARLPARLAAKRAEIRGKITERDRREAARKKASG